MPIPKDQLTFNIVIVEFGLPDDTSEFTTKIKYLNKPVASMLGYATDELVNKPLEFISAPAYAAEFWLSAITRISQGGPNYSFKCDLKTRSGSIIPASIFLTSLPDLDPAKNKVALFFQTNETSKSCEENLSIMQIAVEQSANAVVITDLNGRIEYVNPKFVELTGYSTDELLGHNPSILQSGNTSPEQYQAMWQMLIETGEWRGEIKNKKKNGEVYWAYENISAIKNSRGEITHFLALEEDITQRKQAETALKESEERFRQMAAMTGEWLWEQDPEGYYIYSSTAVNEILGFTPDDIIGKHYSELLTPQDKQDLQTNSAIQEPFYSLINHYRHLDGRNVLTESTGLPIKDTAGKLIKWRGVDRDITARKRAQDALINSEKRNRLVVESALNAIVLMDSFGIITDWNHHAETMFDRSRDEAIGQRVDELIIPPRFRNAHRTGLGHFLQSGEGPILNKLIEHTAIRRDGSEFPVELSVSPLKLDNAYIFSGFIHDITSRKESEKKIRETEVKLAIAHNEMKIAHQIQSSLLPSAPIKTTHFEITGCCVPADQVGGDFYDYFVRGEDHLNMVIADVSGHSVGPALFMVEARSALRTQANRSELPAETLTVLNNSLFEDLNNADYFITMFYLQYHASTGQLNFANAGHPPPLLIRHNQNHCIQLDADGLILGIRKNIIFENKSIPLNQGDMILLYTDGITEAENANGEFFGLDRICSIYTQSAHLEPEGIIEQILKQLKQFCRSDSLNDDITLMLFKKV